MAWRVNVQLADTTHPEVVEVDSMVESATISTSIKGAMDLLKSLESAGNGDDAIGTNTSKVHPSELPHTAFGDEVGLDKSLPVSESKPGPALSLFEEEVRLAV